jgi:UMF1 family MFS transporter
MNPLFKRLNGFGGEVWAWMTYDFANSAFATSLAAVIFNKYFAGTIAGGAAGTDFNVFGLQFNLPGAALFELAILVGTVLTIILGPLLGLYADRTGTRKRFLTLTIIAGCATSALLTLISPGDVILGGLLWGAASAAWLLSVNFYNAFLPQICSEKDLGLVSGISWAIGYIGGGLCLLLNLIMLQNPQLLGFATGTFGIGSVIMTVVVWWGLFSLPIILWVKERPASLIVPVRKCERRQLGRSFRLVRNQTVRFPTRFACGNDGLEKHSRTDSKAGIHLWRDMLGTLKDLQNFRQLWIFLLAYVCFTNGIETTISSASIFGDQELHMDTAALITLFLIVQFTAFPGALLFGVIVDRIGNKIALSIALIVWVVALSWVYNLGMFFDPVTEFRIIAVIIGVVMGGSQAAARSLFASFTPPARSAEFFAFYGVAGRVASIMGPLAFAAVNTATRSLRGAIASLIVFFVLGMVVLWRVDEKEGVRAAREMQQGA